MERQVEGDAAAKGGVDGAADDVAALQKEAANLEWKLEGKQGMKKALAGLLKILQDHPNKLDLPEDEKEARVKLVRYVVWTLRLSSSEGWMVSGTRWRPVPKTGDVS